MKKCHLVFCFLLLLISGNVIAQCPASATAISTESRCKESGTITINALPAAAYTYEIISGPSLSDPTTSNVFTSLGPGNYVIEVTRGGCSITVPATVTGNYVDPGLISIASTGKIACPGGTTCITANQPTGGRLPWKYSIISGPVLKPSQSSPVFCGLTGGTYSIQALDSCGVVRSSQFTIGVDTGYLYFLQYSWDVKRSSCNDIVVCPTTDWYNTSSHSLIKVWYVKPNGDTLKIKGFRTAPTGCDTLVGEAHTYGNWKGIAWDTCGRKWETNFSTTAPSLYVASASPTCGGYEVSFGNMWKYGITVGYTIRKCRDNSIVYSTVQTPPATTFYSPSYVLQYDTCYIFEHYNECGDTVRYNNYSRANTAHFNISGCGGPGCKKRGSGHIQLWQDYHSGIAPVTFTILSGPEGVGRTAIQGPNASWTVFDDMALGTYTIEGVDACNQRDTLTITTNKPLLKSVEVTQVPHCSGGANLHLKITSNRIMCDSWHSSGGTSYTTIYGGSSPSLPTPSNIITTPVTQTVPGTWEGDFNDVHYDSARIYYYGYEGCQDDTLIKIIQYKPPVLSNMTGFVCGSSGVGTLNYTITGGKPPFRFRVKPDIAPTWSAWQDSAIFTGITAGAYDVNVEDACPNGQIRSATFYTWEKSDFDLSAPCADYGDPLTLTVNPKVNYVNYQWYKNNVYLGSGPVFTIPSFDLSTQGKYIVKQTFKSGGCIDSTAKWVLHCSILTVLYGELTGTYSGGTANLTWNTTRDAPGTTFTIERSINGTAYTTIGSIEGLNNTNGSVYNFKDPGIPTVAYYRIRCIAADGKPRYSNTLRLSRLDVVESPVIISPVPFKYWFTIQVKSAVVEKSMIRIYDISGKPIFKKEAELKKGNNTIWIDDDAIGQLRAGAYIVEVKSESLAKQIKVIKE